MDEPRSSRFLPPLPKISKGLDQANIEDLKSKRSRRRSQKGSKVKTIEHNEDETLGNDHSEESNAKRDNFSVFAITKDFKSPDNNEYADGIVEIGNRPEILQSVAGLSDGNAVLQSTPVKPKRKKTKQKLDSNEDHGEEQKLRKKRTVDFDDSCTNPFETGIDEDQTGRKSPTLMPSGDGHREPPSQSVGKLFIEQPKGFVPMDHSKLVKEVAEASPAKSSKPKLALDVAINTQYCYCIFGKFLSGLFAGIALWQCIISYKLGSPNSQLDDYLTHYKEWTTTIQSLFFIFSVITTIFALDRYDMSALRWDAVKELLLCQNGLIVIFIYPVVLLLSLSITDLDYKIGEYSVNSTLWISMTTEEKYNEVIYWRNMNTARCVGAVLGGAVVSLVSKEDCLSQYLKSIREEDDRIPVPEHALDFD